MGKLILLCLILIEIICSCTKGYGTVHVQKNLTIYYNNNKDVNTVKELANYWISRKLILDKPQTIRYFHADTICQLQLIKTPSFNPKTLNFDAIKELQNLEDELNGTIFSKNKVDVVICDSRFNVLNNLNY
jgi:hypothetical protein